MLGGDVPLMQWLALIQVVDSGWMPTLWDREQQAVVQTSAQDVSQGRETPTTLARSCLDVFYSIRATVLL